MESSRVFPRKSRKNIFVQRICGVWSVTLVLSANCKNITGCQLWSKGHLVGLANVNLSFTHFLFPNMICWLCSVAKQIRRRVRPSRGKYLLVLCRRNSAILTCLILYVNMGKCPFPYKTNKDYILYHICTNQSIKWILIYCIETIFVI